MPHPFFQLKTDLSSRFSEKKDAPHRSPADLDTAVFRFFPVISV